MNEKPLNVKDGSQKFKILLFVAFFVVVVGVGFLLTKPDAPLGIATTEVNFLGTNTINRTAVCGGASPATQLQATSTARTFFSVASPSATPVTICRSTSTCVAGAGGIILLNTGDTIFTQRDGYTGAYYCAASASTTVGVTYSE